MADTKAERIRRANEELLGYGNLDAVDDFFHANYVVHVGDKDYRGPKFIKQFVKQLRAAIDHLEVVEVAVLSEAGDTLTWERILSGTHVADLGGIPPTRRKVKWRDMVVSRFDGDKIAEEWTVSELAGELFSKFPRV